MALRKPRASTIENDPIYNIGSFSIVESRGISLCQKPIFELTSVYKYLFPNLLDQSQYNRRARDLTPILESLRLTCANDLGLAFERYFLLDTTPIIAVGYNRDKNRCRRPAIIAVAVQPKTFYKKSCFFSHLLSL
ncbi:MAG: hypothetical protein ACXWM7_01195 [Parachlamydiaceae bacterium]